jgi:hypothetical protein
MTRFIEVKGQDGQWQVMDMQGNPHVICICTGFKAPLYAEYICQALEAYHSDLYSKFLND